MPSTAPQPEVDRGRPEITSSWARSRLSGLRADASPALDRHVVGDSALLRAAAPVLRRMSAELEGSAIGLVLADQDARVIDLVAAGPAIGAAMHELGFQRGVRMGEDVIGTNAIGTPVETRQEVLIRGPEHFLTTFREFTCYGHPIFHPGTRRLAGVLDIGGPSAGDHRLLRPLARRMVRDIEERLLRDVSRDQNRLLHAFQVAARRSGRPVMVVGQGLVLATPAALDLLDPADHAAVRTCAEQTGVATVHLQRLTLVSGRTVVLECTPIDDADGVRVDIVADRDGRQADPDVVSQLPLVVIGEPGSGRTTAARRAVGAGTHILDATEIVRTGRRSWATALSAALEEPGPGLIVENIQLLPEQLTALLAGYLRDDRGAVVLTATPGDHLTGTHAPLVSLCGSRRDLLPLRRRRHEIPRLAQRMLADIEGTDRLRLTSDTLRVLAAQPWPGNLTELHRVIRALAQVRSAGDLIPADLPAAYRGGPAPGSPLRQAEREVVIAAIEAAGGNKQRAARALGVSRSTLYNRMRALGIG
ncbi:sigma-54-dependent Fis family transcriptional regulator [Nocardia sp. alder85J]|uniref:sigma-54-dependent Fis family transcriptional regulator n=1 Tax=Nocardia sp. alder85J TaxID=2862949 RepID=UPI001CD3FF16|nr:helix-turn-helix domain-containing protein [Nocardia sp. alder85J]MCX4095566.1 transcriptional regulator [Nocardia sp. alder85J]